MLILFAFLALFPLLMSTVANAGVIVSTFAGRCDEFGIENGHKSQSLFAQPVGIAVGPDGSFYITENADHIIRKIAPNGMVSTLAGTGTKAFANGQGDRAMFSFPNGIAVDRSGNVFVVDKFNQRIRKITPNGVVTTLAGDGKRGRTNGPSTTAQFKFPMGLAIDHHGNLLVTDTQNQCVRQITSNGDVSVLTGMFRCGHQNGPVQEAMYRNPQGVAVDARGDVYISDTDNNLIRKVSMRDGKVSTIAGSSQGYLDGPSRQARFNLPSGITVDPSGNVYVADTQNSVIRRIDSQTGHVSTIAGSGRVGHTNGSGHQASFANPQGLVYHDGSLYVADSLNGCIRKITFDGPHHDTRRSKSPRPIRYNKDKCAICHKSKKVEQDYFYCSEQCGNSFHADCIRECAAYRRVETCPMCRVDWIYDRIETKIPEDKTADPESSKQ